MLVCTARSITNTSVSAEPTFCLWMPRADWGQYSQESALSQSYLYPQVPSPCVPPWCQPHSAYSHFPYPPLVSPT